MIHPLLLGSPTTKEQLEAGIAEIKRKLSLLDK